MNCSDIETLLPLHLSGELEATRLAAFQAHLRQCPLCALQIEEQARIDQLTRGAMQEERIDTAALELRVRSRIAADAAGDHEMAASRSATQTRNRWIALGAVAAVLLLAIFGGQQYLKWNTSRAYALIAHDHFREVTQHQPRDWVSDPQQIAAMISEEGVPSSVLSGLQENGFQIRHARICTLKGHKYLHLVYSNGDREFSAFFHPQGSLLSLLPLDGNHQGLASADVGAQHLASFQAAHLGVYVVTDESSQAAQDIAGAAASTT
jgi:anti-sigma factor RsiW